MWNYLRQARRIRAEHRGNPLRLQQALQNLANQTAGDPPMSRSDNWSESAVIGPRGGWARDFADLVARQMVGPLLPWSTRKSLLRQAARRNIKPFEANLIIATVQHRLGPAAIIPRAVPPARPRRNWSMPIGIAISAMLEALIIVCIWHLVFG